jgi:hypothetical protein
VVVRLLSGNTRAGHTLVDGIGFIVTIAVVQLVETRKRKFEMLGKEGNNKND